uniref:Uncharacterized protein n=1 Tax=Pristionchus pacificus TaxID=54126 RepID=A0A2A6BJD9_PRIPA|eukprot:PDM66020.1 hypothetical protein PRIPAC_44114 [Pristionchus pacificus]
MSQLATDSFVDTLVPLLGADSTDPKRLISSSDLQRHLVTSTNVPKRSSAAACMLEMGIAWKIFSSAAFSKNLKGLSRSTASLGPLSIRATESADSGSSCVRKARIVPIFTLIIAVSHYWGENNEEYLLLLHGSGSSSAMN